MRLRGHHLICRLGFRGMGYDERFAQTMKEVLHCLKLNHGIQVQVVKDIDILCAACPNRQDNICFSLRDPKAHERIRNMDEIVFEALSLQEEKLYTLEELNRRIGKQFTTAHMDQLCRSCEWRQYGYCDEGVQCLREKNQ